MIFLSHNVFWFQGVPFHSDQPGQAREDILERLIDLYRRIDPDVLSLQEIQSRRTFDLLCLKLGIAGHYSEGATLTQYGGAMMWRMGECVSTSVAGDVTQRVWQVGRSAGYTVCNLHLPSGRQVGRERAAVQRVDELSVATDIGPDLVMGDFNEPPDGPVDRLLVRRGYVDAANHTKQASRPTSLSGNRGDRIFVHSRILDQVTDYGTLGVEDLAIDLNGKTSLSDHLPLWVRLGGG